MITAGTYTAIVDADSVYTDVTSNGNDQISFYAELVDIGEKVKIYLVITDKTSSWVWKKLAAAGWDGVDLDKLDGLGSKECEVSIKYEMWNGENRMRADIMLPRERKTTSGLAAKYGAAARAAVGGGGFKL
jgi:hypothetical protein